MNDDRAEAKREAARMFEREPVRIRAVIGRIREERAAAMLNYRHVWGSIPGDGGLLYAPSMTSPLDGEIFHD